MFRVAIRHPLQKSDEAFCISFGNFLNSGIHGVYIDDTTKVNTFSGTVREQLGLASFRRPLGSNGRIQLNACFIRKKNCFIRL